jgi:hypothetical protein
MEKNKVKDERFIYSNEIEKTLSTLWSISYGTLLAKCSADLSSIPENSSLNADKGKIDALVEIGRKFGFDIVELKPSESKANEKIEPPDVWQVINDLETKWKEELKNRTEPLLSERKFLETAGKMVVLQEVRRNLLNIMIER